MHLKSSYLCNKSDRLISPWEKIFRQTFLLEIGRWHLYVRCFYSIKRWKTFLLDISFIYIFFINFSSRLCYRHDWSACNFCQILLLSLSVRSIHNSPSKNDKMFTIHGHLIYSPGYIVTDRWRLTHTHSVWK